MSDESDMKKGTWHFLFTSGYNGRCEGWKYSNMVAQGNNQARIGVVVASNGGVAADSKLEVAHLCMQAVTSGNKQVEKFRMQCSTRKDNDVAMRSVQGAEHSDAVFGGCDVAR